MSENTRESEAGTADPEGTTDPGAGHAAVAADDADGDVPVPEWDDAYLDGVAARLLHSYDLERDYAAGGEDFEMYARLQVESQKQFFHQSINWANHRTAEHVFVRRADGVSRADLESLVAVGHDLADEWIDPDEEHHGTEFTFVLVVPSIPDDVAAFVADFRDRTLLKMGYYGSYEVNLVVVAPDRERAVASQAADTVTAFELWEELGDGDGGVLARLKRWLA